MIVAENKCNCAYCRSGMQADFVKRWEAKKKEKEVK